MQELKEYFTTKLNHLQNLLNETRLEVNNLDTVKENITSIPFKYDVEKLLKDENYRAEIALKLSNNNRKIASKMLNMSERTLYRIIKRQK